MRKTITKLHPRQTILDVQLLQYIMTIDYWIARNGIAVNLKCYSLWCDKKLKNQLNVRNGVYEIYD